MVKHIILWRLKESLTSEEKAEAKKNAKENLEALYGKIDGLLGITVNINGLESSNCDMMLDSSFESAEALAAYQKHPAHVAAANCFVRPFAEVRLCLDYEA
ncbi:MAG: Dabb family protein [Clostridia bacterium]|nr:Dabb family protein [Clostridia bacterium]